MHPVTAAQAGISRSQAMTEQLPKGYSPRLYNQDLGPLPQKWTWYNIFAFWMSDVHSVGGYVFAASLFAPRAGQLAGADCVARGHLHRAIDR
jgi:cytosine/uracil/thiamine/allantoin permease